MSVSKVHRRLGPSEQKEIENLAKVGTRPRSILAAIKQKNPASRVILNDIYNEIARSKRNGLQNLNIAEALRSELQRRDSDDLLPKYFWDMTCDEHGRIQNLYLAKTTLIQAYCDHHDILILDCTYKTNCYKMPLLNIIGVTGANSTLQIAVVFLRSEEESNYLWAMQTLKRMKEKFRISDASVCFTNQETALINAFESTFRVTPTVLCLWHIMKNIVAYAKKHGVSDTSQIESTEAAESNVAQHSALSEYMATFTKCISVPTIVEHDMYRRQLREANTTVTNYIEAQYLGIWKHKVAQCYMPSVVTFGITTTSRGEGSHSTMKSWLQLSRCNIHEFWNKMDLLWTQQYDQYKYIMARAGTAVASSRQTPFWAATNRRVHIHALQEAYKQWEKRNDKSSCSQQYTKKTGIPCCHTIKALIAQSQILQCNHFHRHWWVNRGMTPLQEEGLTNQPLILPPKTMKDLRAERAAIKSSHRRGNGKHGNRRMPSMFEREGALSSSCNTTIAALIVASSEEEQTAEEDNEEDKAEESNSIDNVELPTVNHLRSNQEALLQLQNSQDTAQITSRLELKKASIRGRIGRHWGTIIGHEIIDETMWFIVQWDKVDDGEANPTPQTRSDFAEAGRLSMVRRYMQILEKANAA